MLGNFSHFFHRLVIFFKINVLGFLKMGLLSVSNGLDPDQARHFLGLDLGLNCLQM